MERKARSDLHQRRSRIRRHAQTSDAVEFFNILTSPQLLETTEALLPEHRQRLYLPMVTLSMFMRQVLQADGSCQKAVNGWAAQRAADGLSSCSVRTGGYCRARQRLPLEMVTALTRLVAVICLATGAALDAAIGPHRGKGSGELGLVRRLLEGFHAGDVMLADALYCNYFLIANVIRLLMAQAGRNAGVDPRGLSATKDSQRLFTLIAQCKVGHRPGRIEPRMRQRRPKPYPWLKTSRDQARHHVRRHGHADRPK